MEWVEKYFRGCYNISCVVYFGLCRKAGLIRNTLVRTKEVSPGLKLPAILGASNPGLTEPASVFRFYLMPLRLKCTEDFALYRI